ncbi:MAG TPA: DMT family transporter [Polyangia bacterium]|jgi:drug/metabolite transporter (DMT)-like permease|nr:DMT family transporter [Polyangia bacterium]
MFLGVVLGLGASASWALANVAVQRSARELGVFRTILWAQLVGIVAVSLLLPFDARTAAPTALTAVWVALAGAAGLLAYVGMTFAFEHGRLTIVVPVMSSWAVIASGLSLAIFREPVRPLQLAGAASVIAGAVVVSRFARGPTDASSSSAGRAPRWLLASFGAALGFGLLIPLIGLLAPVTGRLGVIPVVYGADIALGLPLALRFGVSLAPPRGRAWIAVALAGLFETSGFACIALATRYAPLALVSPLSSLASAFTVLYAWAVLRERPARPVLLGAALVCVGVLTLAF